MTGTKTVRIAVAAALVGALFMFAACSLRRVEPAGITPALVEEFYQSAREGDMYSIKYWAERFPGLVIAKEMDYGLTALHAAAYGGHLEVVEFLLAFDPENNPVNIRSKGGNTALVEAVVHGRIEIARALIARGADVNLANNVGDTPLHWAAAKGRLDMARLLIANRAAVGAANRDDQSPLHKAAANGHPDIIRLLLDHGANPRARDRFERTPLQAAQNRNHEAAAELLRKHAGTR